MFIKIRKINVACLVIQFSINSLFFQNVVEKNNHEPSILNQTESNHECGEFVIFLLYSIDDLKNNSMQTFLLKRKTLPHCILEHLTQLSLKL